MKFIVVKSIVLVNIYKIIDVVSYYERISEAEFLIIDKPELFNDIKSKWHFSATQSYQLETLLRRVEIFCDKKDIEKIIKNCETSNSVIHVLSSKIKNNLVNWSKF